MLRLAFLFLLPLVASFARGAPPDALLVVVGDAHSAYERHAALVARVDRIRADNPSVPLATVIDGDAFEGGNAVARRTEGALDFQLVAALAQRGPVVFNLGNHETDLMPMRDVVARLRAAGAIVICGNAREAATGEPFAPATADLKLGRHELTLVGVTTDHLSTFRADVRPSLSIADPVAWARRNFPALLDHAAVPVVLSHAGLRADRAMLPLVPPGTLFAGAHDHLRFVVSANGALYFHSGSWLDYVSVAQLRWRDNRPAWQVEQSPISAADPRDKSVAAAVQATIAKTLTPAETTIVGRAPEALSPSAAAAFAVAAARAAADADVAVVGGTTFGDGLPAGAISRYAFDAFVRFDGPLYQGRITGARLTALLRRCNQGPDTPFALRTGENLVAVAPKSIAPDQQYRFVTTDWIAHNAHAYLGDDAPALTELPSVRLKAAVLSALNATGDPHDGR